MIIVKRLQRFKNRKNELILRSMIEYMSIDEDVDCGYSQKEIDECGNILDNYIDNLVVLNCNIEEIMDYTKNV